MDPISTAIIAALAASSQDAIKDSYKALKTLLQKKFGEKSDLSEAIAHLEKKPDSEGRKGVLQEEVATAKANDDPALNQLAQDLLDKLREETEGRQIITQTISNVKYAATSGTGNASIGNITEEGTDK